MKGNPVSLAQFGDFLNYTHPIGPKEMCKKKFQGKKSSANKTKQNEKSGLPKREKQINKQQFASPPKSLCTNSDSRKLQQRHSAMETAGNPGLQEDKKSL